MQQYQFRTAYCQDLKLKNPGETIRLSGWIEEKRNLGRILFLKLRDHTGTAQVLVDKKDLALHHSITKLTRESALSIEGCVKKRVEDTKNHSEVDKGLEVHATRLLFASCCAPLPVHLKEEAKDETDLAYRYLFLRTPLLQNRLRARARIVSAFRRQLEQHQFLEVETPILTKPTPEGARDFLVPSRVHPHQCFALPQSPQLFKQLCMIGGIDRYYQIARCFRDEDLRSDRQPEFTQVDIEASFLQSSEFCAIIESILKNVWQMERKITLPDFPRLRYQDAIRFYGTDKPDLRFPYPLIDFEECDPYLPGVGSSESNNGLRRTAVLLLPLEIDWSKKAWSEALFRLAKQAKSSMIYTCVAVQDAQKLVIRYESLDKRPISHEILSLLAQKFPSVLEGTRMIVCHGPFKEVSEALGNFRASFPLLAPKIIEKEFAPLWVVDFPMFERTEQGGVASLHHPFTAAKESASETDPTYWIADAYDCVMNGYEIGGGSCRIIDSDFQAKVFDLLEITREEQINRFGFLLKALSFGAPRHGGIALGLDRIVMLLTGAESIREVISFPKTTQASCLMTNAPCAALEESLQTLHFQWIE